jgi:hypothetical protein
MRNVLVILSVAAIVLSFGRTTMGQSPQSSPTLPRTADISDRALGEVTSIDLTTKRISVRTETSQQITVNVDDKTLIRRVPPGETNVEKAAVVNFADIAVGDRVLARGKLDGETLQTRILLIVSSSELARSAEQSRAEWQRRGISGTIVTLDPVTKEIMLRSRTSITASPIRIAASGGDVRFKRYAPNSTHYKDAIPGTFEQLKVGDYLRALGDRSQDGTSFKPEEILAGSFRMAGGIITEVNQSTREVKIKDIQTRQTLTIIISEDSKLRHLPAELLARMEQSMETTATAQAGEAQEVRVMTPNGPGMRRIMAIPPAEQNQPSRPGQQPSSNRAAVPGAGGPGITMRRIPQAATPTEGPQPENEDYQESVEKLPPINIADLKRGDGVIVSSMGGGDPSRLKVILLVTGVAEFLKRVEEARNTRPGYELDLALPGLGAQ